MADSDKWGIPFFYATAQNAGVTNKGEAFFWQQNNDIFKDSKAGMVRIGKEFEDVQVISTSTGEWEFPYDSGADFYSIDMDMGHASGGETHGCEAAHYMGLVTINETPPKFYFQKQYYMGGPKYQKGIMTHPKVTQKVVGNGFKGFCVVKYNKKDGRSSGHDSVIVEIWWNNDPTNHLKDGWFKVTSIEDKGKWGKGGDTCDGVSDQVFTWSNVQTRFKSGTPEWSLHPIVPEFESGENIHSIGKENMSYSDSEKRGYGKDPRIPRDIEVKILFKFASNNGIARLKNASMREIDPTKSIDDTPNTPPPTDQPGETKTLTGKFKLLWDLNTARTSTCQGTGAGGAGGNTIFYDVQIIDENRNLTNHIDEDYRTRIGEELTSSSSTMAGKKPKQLDIDLMKAGAPGSSPSISAKIWSPSNTVLYTSPTTINPTTLSTSSVTTCSFNFSTNTVVLTTGMRIGIEYTGSSNTDYIIAGIRTTNVIPGSTRVGYRASTGEWYQLTDSELSMVIWE